MIRRPRELAIFFLRLDKLVKRCGKIQPAPSGLVRIIEDFPLGVIGAVRLDRGLLVL